MSDATEGWEYTSSVPKIRLDQPLTRHTGNKLENSDDPRVLAIARYFRDCPIDFGTDMAAAGGFMVGAYMGICLTQREGPDAAFDFLRRAMGEGLIPDEQLQEVIKHTTKLGEAFLEGHEPD